MDSFERSVPRTPEPRAGDAGLVLHGALDVIHMLECELEAFPFLSRGLSVLLIPVSCPGWITVMRVTSPINCSLSQS